MKTFGVAVVLLGLIAAQTAFAQTICAGAEGKSDACAPACSNQVVNSGSGNQGKFNTGFNNIGDANDGPSNKGNFNIGSGNQANCAAGSGLTGGSCDPSNNNGQLALRFCNVYPSDPKCSPPYVPEFTQAQIQAVANVVASCTGAPVTPSSPPPPTVASPPPAVASPPPAPVTPVAPGPTTPVAPGPSTPPAPVQPAPVPTGGQSVFVSDSTADLATLLALFDEHIRQEKTLGRKLKL